MKITTLEQWGQALTLVTENLKKAHDLLDISWEQLEELGAKSSSLNICSARNIVSNAIFKMFHQNEREEALNILKNPSLEELYEKRKELNEEIERRIKR